MKKNSALFVLAFFVLAACDKEAAAPDVKDPETVAPVATVSSFSATMDKGSETRTYLSGEGEEYLVLWKGGENIPITNGEAVYYYAPAEGSEDSSSATLEAIEDEVPESDYYLSWYPSSIMESTDENTGNNLVNFSSEQTYKGGEIYDFPMMAVSGNTSLSFKNLGGIIRLNLTASELTDIRVTSIELASSNLSMSGSFSIDPKAADSEALVSSLTQVEEEPHSVTLKAGEGVMLSQDSPTSFMIIVPPGEYEGLSITISGVDNYWSPIDPKTYTLKAGKKVVVERSKITDIKMTVDVRYNEAKLQIGSTLANTMSNLAGDKSNVKKVVFEVNSKTTSSTTVHRNTTGTASAYASYDESTGTMTISTIAKQYSITAMGQMFNEYKNLVSIEGLENINTDACTGTSAYAGMFWNCSSLTSVDVSSLNIDGRGLANMFNGCSSLTEIDMSSWSGTPTGMSNMFRDCSNLGKIIFGDDFYVPAPSASADNPYGYMFFNAASGLKTLYITCNDEAKEAFLVTSKSNLGTGNSSGVSIYINGTKI